MCIRDSNLDTGMIMLKRDTPARLIAFAISTMFLPAITEESFYRKSIISFRSKPALVLSAVFGMLLYACLLYTSQHCGRPRYTRQKIRLLQVRKNYPQPPPGKFPKQKAAQNSNLYELLQGGKSIKSVLHSAAHSRAHITYGYAPKATMRGRV